MRVRGHRRQSHEAPPEGRLPAPGRLLVVTADIGEGHNAAARVIAETFTEAGLGSEVTSIDALALLGRPLAKFMTWSYRLTLAHAPQIYQFYYDALFAHRGAARVAKRLVGSVFGRRLDRHLRLANPVVIICTHPFGSAGMQWLRRVRGMSIPTATFVTDFAAHPFWVFEDVDVHFVMHELSAEQARRLGARGPVEVSAPPVAPAVRPRPHASARRELDLRRDAFIVLVTGGAWGVGTLRDAIVALLELGPHVQVLAVCGRNEPLRQTLEGMGQPRSRLVTLGFVDTMPELMAAADVVVTNAGGVTALEAFAAARPLVLFDPIAGHGKANAALMERAGLAVVCSGHEMFDATMRELASNQIRVEGLRHTELAHLKDKDLAADLRRLVVGPPVEATDDGMPPPLREDGPAGSTRVTE